MATTEPYETAKGKRYRVRYRRPDHTQTSKRGFRTKKEAELFAASIEVSKAKGEFIDAALGRETVGQLGEAFMASKAISLKRSSYVSLEVSWRLRVEPRWGKTPVGAVEHEQVQKWIDQLIAEKYSPPTIMRDYSILIGILDRAVRARKILGHAARGVDLPKKRESKRSYLTHHQVDLLARNAGTHSTMIYTLAYTGMRWGEMAGLKVSSVDLQRGRIRVIDNAVQIGGTFEYGTPKSGKARDIFIPSFLASMLAERIDGMHPKDLVFGSAGEPPRRPHTQRGWLHGAIARAQAVDPQMPIVSPHELRHTAASLAVSAGANVKAVQRMLGHKSAAMTLDVYADLFNDDLESVATALDRARAESIEAKTGPQPDASQDDLATIPVESREGAVRAA